MHKTVAVFATLGLSFGHAAVANAESDYSTDITAAVRSCAQDRVTCGELRLQLVPCVLHFRGGSIDRKRAEELANAAVRVVRHPDEDLRLRTLIGQCRDNKDAACREVDFLLENVLAENTAALEKAGKADLGRAVSAQLADALGEQAELSGIRPPPAVASATQSGPQPPSTAVIVAENVAKTEEDESSATPLAATARPLIAESPAVETSAVASCASVETQVLADQPAMNSMDISVEEVMAANDVSTKYARKHHGRFARHRALLASWKHSPRRLRLASAHGRKHTSRKHLSAGRARIVR